MNEYENKHFEGEMQVPATLKSEVEDLRKYVEENLSDSAKEVSWQEYEQQQSEGLRIQSLEKKYKESLINANDDIPEPAICLEIVQDDKKFPIGTTGNFSLVIGKAKSRKTFALTAALAAAISENTVLNISSTLPKNDSKVLIFDTEQSRYDVKKCLDRILKQAGLPTTKHPENLIVSSLRKFNPSERFDLIEHVVDTIPDIGFLVIDGVRDIVTSINDEEQATKVCAKLLKWTEEKGIHIVTVLHENKGDNNARGHLGTEMVNKAETVISITKDSKDKAVSVIECNVSRQIEFEPYAFTISLEGLPVLADDFQISANRQKTLEADQIAIETHKEHLEKVFSKRGMLRYSECWQAIQRVYKPYYKTFGNNKAIGFLSYFQEVGLIQKSGKNYFLKNG